MDFTFKLDMAALEKRFDLSGKNLAYASVNAINETAKQIQALERANVAAKFKVRKSAFMQQQAAIIKPFASVGMARPYAEIAVGQKPRLLLSTFEKGGTRLPFVGKNMAIPLPGSPARPSFSAAVAIPFQSLGLKPMISAAQAQARKAIKGGNAAETRAARKDFTRAASGGRPWVGNSRTYLIPGVGVYQRTGPKTTVKLFSFYPSKELIPKLGFVAIAQEQGQSMFTHNMEAAVIGELERRRR